MAQEALSNQAVCEGRFTLGLGASHHWVIEDMLGLSYERPAHQMRNYLEVLNAALRGPGSVDVENDGYRVHSPMDVTDWGPNPVLLAALAPVMLRLAGEHASGTILWMADERAIAEHVVPRITKAAAEAGRPLPRVVAGIPVAICPNDEVDERAGVGEPRCSGTPSSARTTSALLERGDATDVGDILAAGTSRPSLDRLRAFRDAGRHRPGGPRPRARAPTARHASSRASGPWRSSPLSVRSCEPLAGGGRSAVVVDDDLAARGNRLAGQDPSLLDLAGVQGVVHAHRDLPLAR